jgi:hypothetical protein
MNDRAYSFLGRAEGPWEVIRICPVVWRLLTRGAPLARDQWTHCRPQQDLSVTGRRYQTRHGGKPAQPSDDALNEVLCRQSPRCISAPRETSG